MARRSQHNDEPEPLRKELVELLTNFAAELRREDFREKVIALVPAYHKLRDLGSSLMPGNAEKPAMERILAYLQRYSQTVIDGDEIMVVSGIGEWARRVRQLRVEFGWWIYSGKNFKQMAEEERELSARMLAFASAANVSADTVELQEFKRVLSKPDLAALANDLHERGLLPAGEYMIHVWW